MPTNTVRFHRVLRATPEKIYRAFVDADAMAKWLPPNGFTGKVHHLDAKVGGVYKMSFTNFSTGRSHSFGGNYLELVPHERIRYTDKFDDPNLPGEMQTILRVGPNRFFFYASDRAEPVHVHVEVREAMGPPSSGSTPSGCTPVAASPGMSYL